MKYQWMSEQQDHMHIPALPAHDGKYGQQYLYDTLMQAIKADLDRAMNNNMRDGLEILEFELPNVYAFLNRIIERQVI
jgi:hypothetical protein